MASLRTCQEGIVDVRKFLKRGLIDKLFDYHHIRYRRKGPRIKLQRAFAAVSDPNFCLGNHRKYGTIGRSKFDSSQLDDSIGPLVDTHFHLSLIAKRRAKGKKGSRNMDISRIFSEAPSNLECFIDILCWQDCYEFAETQGYLPNNKLHSSDDDDNAEPNSKQTGFRYIQRKSVSQIERHRAVAQSEDSVPDDKTKQKAPRHYISVGCHPIAARQWPMLRPRIEELLAPLDESAEGSHGSSKARENIIALGEVGLDYNRVTCKNEQQYQRQVFEEAIALAVSLKRPLVVHLRDANDDALSLLRSVAPTHLPMHFHCFLSGVDLAEALLEHFPNSMVGVTGAVTFASAAKSLVKYVPLDRLLTETDAPFMAPVPWRGSAASPAMVGKVVEEIASSKQITPQEAALQLRENARSFYGI